MHTFQREQILCSRFSEWRYDGHIAAMKI